MVLLILFFGRPFNEYFDEISVYLSMAAIVAVIVRFVDESLSAVHRFVRLLYPILLFMLLYRETGGMMFLMFDHFFDAQLVSFESRLFGMEPTLFIDRHLLSTWLTELFSACYLSYYFMIPGFLIPLFFLDQTRIIRRSLAAMSLTFFFSFLLFSIFPIEGPRYHFAGQYLHNVEGPLFRRIVTSVIDMAAVRGGCMPSSHVGVALVVLAYTFKVSKKAGWLLLPINIGLAIGTVWGRFHYVSDVFVGAAIGLGAVWFVEKYYDRWTAPIVTRENMAIVRETHAT